MAVAHHEQRFGHVDREIEGRARGQVLDVDVAAIGARRHRVELAEAARRPGRHDAEEGCERHLDALGEFRDLALEVEGNHHAAVERELVGQPALVHAHGVDAIGHARRRLQHMHGEDVARRGAGDGDGAADHMRPEPAMLHLGVDADEIGQHRLLGDAEARKEGLRIALVGEDALMRDGVDGDGVAGIDAQNRLGGAPQIAPMHGLRPAFDTMAPAAERLDELGVGGALQHCFRDGAARRGGRHQRLRRGRAAAGAVQPLAQEITLVASDQLEAEELVDEIGIGAALRARGGVMGVAFFAHRRFQCGGAIPATLAEAPAARKAAAESAAPVQLPGRGGSLRLRRKESTPGAACRQGRTTDMVRHRRTAWLAALVIVLFAATAASAQISDDVVKIGVLTDLSGPASDATGEGSVVAAQMAAEDFGATVAGKPIKVVGAVSHPYNTPDLTSFVLQAQASKAKIIGLASGPPDNINAIKLGGEFGLFEGGQQMAGLLVLITDVHALGLKAAQGLLLTTSFYWDMDEQTRAWSKRFFDKLHKAPTMWQAGVYSSVTQYLKAIKATGSDDALKVTAKMREAPIEDFFARHGRLRDDGLMVHDLYLVQVKTPQESKAPWDYYKILATIPGDKAFPPPDPACPLVKR